jgi:hypothetical protein
MLSEDVQEKGYALLCVSLPQSDCKIRIIPEVRCAALRCAAHGPPPYGRPRSHGPARIAGPQGSRALKLVSDQLARPAVRACVHVQFRQMGQASCDARLICCSLTHTLATGLHLAPPLLGRVATCTGRVHTLVLSWWGGLGWGRGARARGHRVPPPWFA